jgi:hypothetical protein
LTAVKTSFSYLETCRIRVRARIRAMVGVKVRVAVRQFVNLVGGVKID